MNKRRQLARVLYASGMAKAMGWRESKQPPTVLIYAYHRVLDTGSQYPFDLELISAGTDQFERQVQWLSRNTTPMTFADLARRLQLGQTLPPRPSIVTFDDGFVDNYQVAFPILKKYNVPATFFVSTQYLGSGLTFWFDWLAHRVLSPRWTKLVLAHAEIEIDLPDGLEQRRQLLGPLLQTVKALDGDAQRRVIDDLVIDQRSQGLGEDRSMSVAMDWEMVREMDQAGMEIGSHGVNHYMLAKLDTAALDIELVESRKHIAEQLQSPPAAIAYPDGGDAACDRRVFKATEGAGYEFGCTYMNGVNPLSALNRFALSRKAVELHTSQAEFVCAANLPWLY